MITQADEHIMDRKLMFQEGVVVTVLTISKVSGKLEIDIIPKGITTAIDPNALVKIKENFASTMGKEDMTRDRLYSKDRIAKEMSRLFIEYIGKNPVVIPIIIED
jgi:mRNA degradation ribonuclease J1/J2